MCNVDKRIYDLTLEELQQLNLLDSKDLNKLIIEKDKCLEINTKVQNAINDEHTLYILSLYKKLGGKHLTLSSDAHAADRYCSSFDKYIKIIKEEGFDHLCYFVNRERKELAI